MTDKFIEKAKEVHGDKYDYSSVNYIDCYTKIVIVCKIHSINIITTPTKHLKNNGYDCKDCLKIFRLNFKKSNKIEFIEKSIIEHGNKYDYSKIEYNGSQDNVTIICKEHGEFKQTPNNHLRGKGCFKCGIISSSLKRVGSTDEFIEKSIIKYGDRYDYSKIDYIGNNDKVIIICKEHGEFLQTPQCHLVASIGCIKCSGVNKSNKTEFIKKSKKIHGNKYDYSLVNYIQSNSKVIIICKEHGEFLQTPSKHTNSKQGCIKCSGNFQLNTEEFVKRAKNMHGDKYDYSKANYNNYNKKITIICKEHGEFEQNPYEHYKGHNCPKCRPNYSKVQIQWLNFIQSYKKNHIQHAENEGEFSIPETRFKADGYCKETNTIYEFHGDLWHGNPKLFKSDDVSFFGTTYGELYQKTIEKEEIIRSLGFNLVVMWELDWKRIINSINILKRKFKISKK